MDKAGKQFRYSFSDSRDPGGTFIAQPESDNTKINDTESSDYESEEDEIESLKERNKSAYNEKQSRADDFEPNSWQRLDSFQESRPNEYSDTYRTTNDQSVSLDAISLNRNRTHFPPGKSNDLPDPPENKGEQFVKPNDSTPPLFRTDSGRAMFFDAVVVYADIDIEAVMNFVEIVKSLVLSKFQYEPVIEYYDQGRFCSSNVSIAEDVLNKASVVFIYLTKHVNNDYFDLFVDEAVSLTRLGMNQSHVMSGRRTTDRQWALRPVHSLPVQQRDYKTPAGLVSIRGIDWFNKDTEHTRQIIISIMREARRIKEEAERNQLLASSQPQGGFNPSSLPNLEKMLAQLISNQPHKMAYRPPVTPENENSDKVTIKFTPSARPKAPEVVYQSPGIPYNQPPSLHANQQMYGLQQRQELNIRQNPTERTFQSFTQVPMNQDMHNHHQHMPPLRQSNVQTPLPGSRPDRSQQFVHPSRSNNESFRLEELRIHRTRHRRQNDSDSSESESSSSDDDSDDLEDLLPKRLKKKRNINIFGCRFVQLGSNNQVLDGPVLPTKKNKESKSKQDKPTRKETPPLRSEPSPCLEDEELEKQQKQDSNAVEMVATEQPLEPPFLTAIQGVHSSPSSRTSTQGFHSSVTEDNLDLSNRAQSDVNTNLVSSPSHKASSHKDLTLDQFSGTGMTNSDNDTYKYHNSKQLNVLSVSDKVLNLPLKNDDELQEYQLTVNGKRKGSFTDDPDKSDSDNEKVLSESDSERNIQLCSSRNDSYNLSKDTDLFGDGPKTAGDLNKQDSNNKKVLGDSDAKRNVDVDSSGYDTNILIEDTDVESSGYNSNILTEDTDLCEDGPQTFGMLDKPYGELYSIPNLQSIVPQRQSRLKFMDTITKSLQIRSPALSSEASNVNVTDSDKEDDLD